MKFNYGTTSGVSPVFATGQLVMVAGWSVVGQITKMPNRAGLYTVRIGSANILVSPYNMARTARPTTGDWA